MPWTNPKTDWDTNLKNPVADDFNRIEGNIDYLKTDIETKKGLIVDAINTMGRSVAIESTHAELAAAIKDISDDATAGVTDVLEPKTFYQGGTKKIGTMPNNGPSVAETVNLTSQNQEYTIDLGYHSGLRKIKAVITNLAAGVIKAGITVGGILGTFTSDATATASQILSGITAYVNGSKITGTMPNNGAQSAILTTQGASKSIPAGYTSGGTVTASFANLSAGNVKNGVNLGGVIGTFKGIKQVAFFSQASGDAFPTFNLPASCVVENSIVIPMLGAYGGAGAYTIELTTTQIICSNAYNNKMIGSNILFIEFEPGVIKSKQTLDIPSSPYTGVTGARVYTATFNAVNLSKTLFISRKAGVKSDGNLYCGAVSGKTSTSVTILSDEITAHIVDVVEFN